MRRLAPLLALLATIVLALAACADEPADPPAEDAAEDPATAEDPEEGEGAEAPEAPDDESEDDAAGAAHGAGADFAVVTSVFALASLAEEIAPGAEIDLLLGAGQDPHDVELSPGDRASIEDADALLYMGDLGFQPQVEAAAEQTDAAVVAVADVIGEEALLAFDDDHDHDHDDEGHEDHDDEGHEDHDDEGHEDHDHGPVDAHVWLSPELMSPVVTAMAEAFAELDPDHAGEYERAAEESAEALLGLEDDIDEALTACEHDTALVGHEAWAYLFEPRDLEQMGLSGAGGHGEVSPQRLAELADLVEAEGIPVVFAEPQEGRESAEALAREAGIDLVEVDPMAIPREEWDGRSYADVLMDQVERFAEGLRCDT